MLKQFAHIVLSCWLALLLLFGGTPKEFIHLFTAHTDTVHGQHKPGELSFENEHHHCSFLSFSITPFLKQDSCSIITSEVKSYPRFYESLPVSFISISRTVTTLRGPPSLC